MKLYETLKSLLFPQLLRKSFITLVALFLITSLPLHAEQEQQAPKLFEQTLDQSEEEDQLDSPEVLQQGEIENESKTDESDNRTTAEKLESLKSEVLAVNRDLFILEEDLLFPASTQMAVYFSVDIGYFFSLDNIKIKIDDKQVTHYLYTEKDVSALYRGAIQKVYLGNISTGEHEIVAILIGEGTHKRKYRRAVSLKFEKGTEAKALEIQLRDDEGKLQPKLNVVEW